MKKHFLLAATAAMALIVSCMPETSDDGKASITVKIAGSSSQTRLPEAPATDLAPTINPGGTHYVYVLTSGTVVHSEPLTVTEEGQEQALAGGEKRFDRNSSVYILANIPENVTGTPSSYGSMSAISEAVSAISYLSGGEANLDYTQPAMGNATGTAAQIGQADISGVATVEVALSPLFSRVELQGIIGGPWVKSFTVKGVYLDDYYSSYSMTGAGSVLNSLGQASTIPDSQFGDQVADGNGAWEVGNGPVTAAEDKVWAYHVGAGSLVRIIVALDDVIIYKGKDDGDGNTIPDTTQMEDQVDGKFVTVTGYSRPNFTTFERGYIYSVSPITFDQVGEINDDMVAITAEVSVKKWVKVSLDPITE